ncbi:hypothetical protein NX722_19150 [Endozoicomonas gorgoniicola]|uniref:Uncharacterized protein n=1 Tax=Endozoicomonas gorgoniicola TaxID=1234144 RepID=A0ABT3MZ89_9GAMM|nr:hypothetical protein [Endozoicomonas gorgoniicola]MCW7554693.1 hypothetical protein [Endozoicomonas gorgoniicola]
MKFVRCILTAKVRNGITVFLCCLFFSSLSFSDNSIHSIKFEDTHLYEAINVSIDKYFSHDSLIENSQYSDENRLSREAVTDLVLHFSTEDSKWYKVFSELDVEESLLDEIKNSLSKKGKRRFLEDGDTPYIIDAMVRLLSVVIEKNTDDDIFDAVSSVRKDFAYVLSGKKNKNEQSKNNSDVSIHLIWFRLTGRKTSWGHEIPNTDLLPHQQTIYDWAFYNPDKQVFLWYDSYGLSEEAISQYQDFERTLQSYGLDNVNVLDVKKIDWRGSKINNYNVYENEFHTSTIQSEIDFGDKNDQDLGQKVNFFRINILRNSCSAIESAMKASAKKLTNCPH